MGQKLQFWPEILIWGPWAERTKHFYLRIAGLKVFRVLLVVVVVVVLLVVRTKFKKYHLEALNRLDA